MKCLLDPERQNKDKLDSVGNTTAAIGKGFAIGSAALAATSLLASYIHSQPVAQSANGVAGGVQLILNMINPLVLTGAIVGASLHTFLRYAYRICYKIRKEMVELEDNLKKCRAFLPEKPVRL